MATKRPCVERTTSKKAKRQMSKTTFDKWKRIYEQSYQAMTWLRCSVDSVKSLISTLWYSVCKQYESRIDSLKNFSRAWIEGFTNHKISNIVDHATSEQHKAAMAHLTKERAWSAKLPVASYAPIASSFQSTLDPAVKRESNEEIWHYLLFGKGELTIYQWFTSSWNAMRSLLGSPSKPENQHIIFYTTEQHDFQRVISA